jgi:DNA polymerase-3 subunit epsilon
VAEFGYEVTGNELIALLLESDEIKRHKPVYNRQQRRIAFSYGLAWYHDLAGYLHLNIEKNSVGTDPITTFHNLDEAKLFMEEMIDKFQLCQKFCGLYDTPGACFYHQVGKCIGACTGEESFETYNLRVQKLINYCSLGDQSFLIIMEGRRDEEISVVKILKGAYCGFEFFDTSSQLPGWYDISESIPSRADNRDVRMLIKSYVLKHPKLKIVKL